MDVLPVMPPTENLQTTKKKLPLSEKYIHLLINLPTHTYITNNIARYVIKKLIFEIEKKY